MNLRLVGAPLAWLLLALPATSLAQGATPAATLEKPPASAKRSTTRPAPAGKRGSAKRSPTRSAPADRRGSAKRSPTRSAPTGRRGSAKRSTKTRSGRADPFATPGAMLREGDVDGRSLGGSPALPLVTLRAYVELRGQKPVALLEISGVGVRRVRAGDSLSVQASEGAGTLLGRRRLRARSGGAARARSTDSVFDDGEDAPEVAPSPRRAPRASAPGARVIRASVITLKILDVRDGQVLIEFPSLKQRLTLN